jgi:recombinational DNA repair protein (RecF pathway)
MIEPMSNDQKDTTASGLSLREAMHLQTLESNPLDAKQVAMFEMFDREGWSDERRRNCIRKRVLDPVGVHRQAGADPEG